MSSSRVRLDCPPKVVDHDKHEDSWCFGTRGGDDTMLQKPGLLQLPTTLVLAECCGGT